MRFFNFLNEDNIIINGNPISEDEVRFFINELWPKLEKDCKKYIRELISDRSANRYDNLLQRGASKLVMPTSKQRVRKDRKPKDTPGQLHEAFDQAFKNIYGWKARSQALFCTANRKIAKDYGKNVYLIFPIGNYEYLYSRQITDLYAQGVEDGGMFVGQEPTFEMILSWGEKWEKEYATPGTGGGSWHYKDREFGMSFGELEDVAEFIAMREKLSYDEVVDELEWIPSISKVNFIRERKDYFNPLEAEYTDEQLVDIAEKYIRGKYNDDRLVEALNYDAGKTEIMVKTDTYYAVYSDTWYPLIKKIIFDGVKPEELLDLLKRKQR